MADPVSTGVLLVPPSRWYLDGFLVPQGAEEDDDPQKEDEVGAGNDDDREESAGQEPAPRLLRGGWLRQSAEPSG